MLRNPSAAVLAVLAAFVGGAAAQATRKYVDEEHGFEIRVPKWLDVIPVKPGDEQTLARFKGKKKSAVSDLKGEFEVYLLVVRIERGPGPTSESDQDADGRLRSLAEHQREFLNGGRTLSEYLKRRDYKHQLVRNNKLFRKPIEDRAGRPYVVYEMSSIGGRKYGALIRAFVTEDQNEIFGLVVLGLNPFDKETAP